MTPRLTPAGPGMWRLADAPRIQGPFHFPSLVPDMPVEPDMLRLITVHVRDYINGIDPARRVLASCLPWHRCRHGLRANAV